MKVRHIKRAEKIELQMTPMIDIVFQLLIFFVMTFKIVALEGDFNIKMPATAPQEGAPDEDLLPPLRLRLGADADGKLASITMNEQAFSHLAELHNYVVGLIGAEDGPSRRLEGAEVELETDYQLRYEYIVAAITAVSGKIGPDGSIIKLIDKIRFAPPKTPPPAGT